KSAIAPLVQLAASSPLPEGRMHSLYALAGLGGLSVEVVLPRLVDEHPRVREHALRLSEVLAADSPAIRARISALSDDSEMRVRYQAAFSAGVLDASARIAPLAAILKRDGADRWVRLAVLSSLADGSADVLGALAGDAQFRSSATARTVLVELAGQVGAQARQSDVLAAPRWIETLPNENKLLATAMVVGLTEGLARSGSPLKAQVTANPGKAKELLGELITGSRKTAVDEARPPAERAEAIRTLGLAPFAENRELLPGLLGTRQPQEVQLATLAVIARSADPEIGTVLIEAWPSFGPKLRATAMEAILCRHDWLLKFLDAVEKEDIPLADLEPARVRLLEAHAN